MTSPFPGVDPYLEGQGYWPDFRAGFITRWREALYDVLSDHYEARIDERLNPEFEARETFIEIRRRPKRTLVAVLELLSDANKEEPGRRSYLDKRNALLREKVHLVELDLLLGGRRLPLSADYPPGNYFALISHVARRPDCSVYAWTIQQRLPVIPIALQDPDPDVQIDLAEIFALSFQRGRYERSIDYTATPALSLSPAEREWVRQVAAAARD